MLADPSSRYRPFPTVHLPQRQWPTQTLQRAPVWLSTDLRDGNQALFEPMNAERKLRLFAVLVDVGFKQIEVGFPAASTTDFGVVRQLIEQDLIPADVTPMVMTQLRADLIERTVASLAGARRAIVHLYNAVAPVWRDIVFGLSVEQVDALVAEHVALLRRLTDQHPQTEWILQYSPETFCMAELDVSLRVCNTATRVWGASAQRPVIINLPTTVEVATPNVFADQIEWMDRHLAQREHIVLSVHPHNDRGTGVACAELALLAGADRVEGCLFGNGERSGNLDLVTLALNLYTQGIAPGLDFSDINALARVAEDCTGLPIHPRHPYVGDLVFTAFSGSHQDAIAKGLAVQAPQGPWQVPYLPLDPKELGRSYEGLIRVNSQSGKGGIAFLLQRDHDVVMPRRMQIEFSAIVQRHADSSETELDSQALWRLFSCSYLQAASQGHCGYRRHRLSTLGSRQQIELEVVDVDGNTRVLHGEGDGAMAAAVAALQLQLRIDHYQQSSQGHGVDAQAIAVIEAGLQGQAGTRFGAGQHSDIVTAMLLALCSAANRLMRES